MKPSRLAAAAVLTLACTTYTGCVREQGFTIHYASGSMAVGSLRTIEIWPQVSSPDDGCTVLENARSDNPDVIDVVEVEGCKVRLESSAAGEATIRFERKDGEEGEFSMRAEDIDRVELSHTCTLEREAAYVTGTKSYLEFIPFDDDGEELSGLIFPVDTEPADAVEVDLHHNIENDPYLHFPDEPGLVELEPTVSGDGLTARVIDRAAIDGVELWDRLKTADERNYGELETAISGDFHFYATPTTGGTRVCTPTGLVAIVTAVTPSVCRPRSDLEPADESTHELEAYPTDAPGRKILVSDAGECVLDVELTDSEGVTLTQNTVSLQVMP